MRTGRDARLVLVAAQTVLTSVSLSLTGEVTPVAAGVVLGLPVGWLVRRRSREPGIVFDGAFNVLALVALGYFLLSALHLRLLAGATALTLPGQAYYLALPPRHRTLWRLQVLSFFQLIALAATTTAVFFVVALCAYLALSLPAMVLAALESASPGPRRALALPPRALLHGVRSGVLVLIAGAVLFVLLPRYEAGLGEGLGRGRRRLTGFSDRVRLGDIGRIKQDDSIVMRARVSEPRLMLNWRGLALDEFTGRSWRRTTFDKEALSGSPIRVAEAPAGGAPVVDQDVLLEPLRSRVLFHLGAPLTITSQDVPAVQRDAWGNIERWWSSRKRVRYQVRSLVAVREEAPELADELREKCLQLPDVDPRVVELATSLTRGSTDDGARARVLERWLREEIPYSLDVDDAGVDDPVGAFLLERRPGHCEYFASGMTVLLRCLGVPARIVNGYQRGSWSRFSRRYVVRQRDAHSWVEAWIEGRGWVTYDPTPPVDEPVRAVGLDSVQDLFRWVEMLWDDKVVGFNYSHQLSALITLREWLAALLDALRGSPAVAAWLVAPLAGAGGGVALLRWLRRDRRPSSRVAFWARVERLLRRRGHARRPGCTALELAAAVGREHPREGAALRALAEHYHAVRFGGVAPDPELVAPLWATLKALPSRRPRPVRSID